MKVPLEIFSLNRQRNQITQFKPRPLKDLTSFCNAWTSNIKAQGWYAKEVKPSSTVTCISNLDQPAIFL